MDYIKIAQEVIKIESNELADLAGKIDNNIEKAVDLILKSSGKLVIIGVGKSGLIGAKIAATMASTGTSSFFVHPTEAMHGDLGMFSRGDVALLISYSGESEEVVNIAPHLKRLNIPILTMNKSANSTLSTLSDIFLDISITKEACPLNTAPTSSTTVTLALGDALSVCLMRARGFKHDDFASFHPGGSLGKKLFVKLSQFTKTTDLPIISHSTNLHEAIVIMSEGKLGSVMIEDDDKNFIAILSDGDLRRALLNSDFSLEQKAIEYATKNPLTIEDDSILASQALKIIEDKKIQILVVTNNNKIKGIVHIHSLIEAGIK